MKNPFLYDTPKLPAVRLESLNYRRPVYQQGRFLMQNALYRGFGSAVQMPVAPEQAPQNPQVNATMQEQAVVAAPQRQVVAEGYAELAAQAAHIEASQQAVADARQAIAQGQ